MFSSKQINAINLLIFLEPIELDLARNIATNP
jgi:hypothetical protein